METNSNNAKSPLKGIVIALSVVAAILLGVLIYIWVDRNALIDDLTIEKDQLTEQLGELQMDYQNLSSNNSCRHSAVSLPGRSNHRYRP